MEKVTFVLTCCGRVDLLERTLDTFFEHNDYPIERYIITEDSADEEVFEQCRKLNKEKYNNKLEFIFNHDKLGQSASIDKAYSMVNTEYIFHCEEDWEFYRGGFIQDSIKVLKTQPKVLQVWIRPKSDKILNKIEQKRYTLPGGVKVRKVLPVSFKVKGANEDGTDMVIENYMGFSWNPGVKRKKDWELLEGGYSFFEREHLVDHHYRDLGYMVVSLSEDDNDGYVRHTGWGRRAAPPVYRKKVNVLGVGHPRTGTGYTSKLLQSWGLQVGHEKWEEDGIVAWQCLLPQEEARIRKSNRMPFMTENIELDKLDINQVVHSVRNPKTAIPSIIKTGAGSKPWRSLWVPFSKKNTEVENAILSIVHTDLRIEGFFPERFTYQIEKDADLLYEHLSDHFHLIRNEDLPSKQTNKKRDYDKEVDWGSVRPRFRILINDYCRKYGYEIIYKNQ